MQLIDLKMPGKCLKTFTTFTGSVTSIACDPTEPIVASTSLDRYLRIHNLDTKELLYKVKKTVEAFSRKILHISFLGILKTKFNTSAFKTSSER